MSTLIKNARIITADQDYIADLFIDREKITTIGSQLAMEADRTIDATGRYVIPGGIDVHTHLDMPFGGTTSSDDFETGTRAAAFGGTTTIIDFAIQAKGTKMRDALDTWWKKAEGKACADYGLHMIITDLPDAHMEDMNEMVREGLSSFKLFMAYPGVLMVDDATIFKAMRKTAENGGLICMHAENGSAIDIIVKKAVSEEACADISRTHAADDGGSRSGKPGDRPCGDGGVPRTSSTSLRTTPSSAFPRLATRASAYAETCPQYLSSIED
jgi:dihydropyrimidinase